jgi:D-alanyl-D-alanine carboxypeptidase/D-alanyl-D-alanine-endopeptidase (penicillin-binding protein 4)
MPRAVLTSNRSTRRRAPVVLAALAALAQVDRCPAQELNGDVQRQITQSRLSSARVGICVLDASNGETLVSIRADDRLIPASNLKLLTSGAALLTLGSAYEFKTQLLLDGDRLIVKGGGDPAFADPRVLERMTPKRDVEDVLSLLVAAANKAGVRKVSEIIIDDRVFDRDFVNPAWPEKHLHHGYGAEVAGLNFHANVLHIFTEPGPQGFGTRPTVTLDPAAPWLPITIKAQTVAQNKNTAWVTRDADANSFTLLGDVGVRASSPIEITLHEVPDFFGHILADRLTRAGIEVADDPSAPGTPRSRLAEPQDRFPNAKVVGMVTTPIAEVLRRCNADSENLYAESLMKTLGNTITHEPGSWENGTAVVRMMLSQRLSPDAAASTTMIDGSGLSADNRVSPQTLARWLASVSEEKVGDMFVNSLAQPGKQGTLEKRFQGVKLRNEVRGKSGFINGVRALSGFLTSPTTGRRVVYSIIVNDISSAEQTEDARKLHEHVVKVADEWLSKQRPPEAPKKGG